MKSRDDQKQEEEYEEGTNQHRAENIWQNCRVP